VRCHALIEDFFHLTQKAFFIEKGSRCQCGDDKEKKFDLPFERRSLKDGRISLSFNSFLLLTDLPNDSAIACPTISFFKGMKSRRTSNSEAVLWS